MSHFQLLEQSALPIQTSRFLTFLITAALKSSIPTSHLKRAVMEEGHSLTSLREPPLLLESMQPRQWSPSLFPQWVHQQMSWPCRRLKSSLVTSLKAKIWPSSGEESPYLSVIVPIKKSQQKRPWILASFVTPSTTRIEYLTHAGSLSSGCAPIWVVCQLQMLEIMEATTVLVMDPIMMLQEE